MLNILNIKKRTTPLWVEKKQLLIILISLCTLFWRGGEAYAQNNLVSNPSFEDTVACPLGGDQLYKAINWSSFRNTPDYFNSCCTNINCGMGVPNNIYGYQFAHTGNAYAGLITYYDPNSSINPYREYIGGTLVSPTVAGQKYFVTFYVNFADITLFATNKLGIKLSTSAYSNSNPYPVDNLPTAYSDSIYSDTLGWSKISFSFVADSSYNYLILGNFFDNSNTDTIGSNRTFSYYFLDDICLSTDSMYCDNFTSVININSASSNSLIESYSLTDTQLIIKFTENYFEKSITIYNTLGQCIFNGKTSDLKIELNLQLKNSLLLINIISNKKIETKKLFAIGNQIK